MTPERALRHAVRIRRSGTLPVEAKPAGPAVILPNGGLSGPPWQGSVKVAATRKNPGLASRFQPWSSGP